MLALTYDTVATVTQVTSLLMFVSLFVAVIAYVLWPGNRQRFEAAQRSALGLNRSAPGKGDR